MTRYITVTPVSSTVSFDNDTNGFTATDAQAAIEEARETAQGFPRAGIRSSYNSTVGNNNWLGPSELLPNTPLLISPLKLQINEITWANQNTNVQFRIEFRTGSRVGPIIYTLTVTSPNSGSGFVSGLTLNLTAGQRVHAQYKDDGQNVSDFDLILWVSRVP
jgi:hypothetical protein